MLLSVYYLGLNMKLQATAHYGLIPNARIK